MASYAKETEKTGVQHVESPDDLSPKENAAFNGFIQEAKLATEQEQAMSLWQGIKLYPKAIGWSVLLSTAIIMEGYGMFNLTHISNVCPC